MKVYSSLFAMVMASPVFAGWPTPTLAKTTISNFTFDSGESLPNLNLHYQTFGQLKTNPDWSSNAVIILHGSTGQSEQFLNDEFAGVLFNPGQALDANKYFILLPDSISHGNSSKPSNTGLRTRFPGYQYSDMVRATYRLATSHLNITRARLVMGVSMGGMHTYIMGTQFPSFADALFPIACLPIHIAGQNRLWRKFAISLIRNDPAWANGEYATQPIAGLGGALLLLQTMLGAPAALQAKLPTRAAVDAYVDETLLPRVASFDANDQIYVWNASATYDPEADLGKIRVPLTAVNFADDMINPP